MTEPKDVSTDEIKVHLEYLREGVDEIKTHLVAQNGRLRTAESDIAVIKDRTSEARQAGGKWGGLAGGVAGGVVTAFLHFFNGAK